MNMLKWSCHSSQSDIRSAPPSAAARRADWGRISEAEAEEAQLMLPARVVGTNRLISSSGAKDGHKVTQPALTHAGQCGNNIISEDWERELHWSSSSARTLVPASVCVQPSERCFMSPHLGMNLYSVCQHVFA